MTRRFARPFRRFSGTAPRVHNGAGASANASHHPPSDARVMTEGRDRSLVGFFSEYNRLRTAVMVVLLAIAGVLEGIGVAAMLPLLDQMVAPGAQPEGNLAELVAGALGVFGLEPSVGVLLVALVVMFILKGVVSFQAMLLVGFVVARVTMELRLRLLRAIVHAEWRHVLQFPSGYIANAVSREAQRSAMTYREFCQVIAEGMQVVVYLALAFVISWQIAVLALVVGLGIMGLLRGHLRKSRNAGHDQTQILKSISARVTDSLPSLKPLKVMGREEYLLPLFENETRAFHDAQQREIASTEFLNRSREPFLVAALAVGLWSVLAFSPLTSTSIMVMALLFYRTVTTITNMQYRWVTVAVGESSFRSIMEHIHEAEDARETWALEGGDAPPAFEVGLELENVGFSYDDHPVLESVTGTIAAGAFVALVGPSGSGKTTITDLIAGLIRPQSGRILIDGVELGDIDASRWRRGIGYVPQDPMLFSDTVRGNITLGDPSVTDEQVEKALRDAGAWGFVTELQGGLDRRIGDLGQALSGGQKQRLAIARALATQPRLLILDEPTTALDQVTEAEVCQTISALKGDLTILAISHQAAIREIADEVWELKDGKLSVVTGAIAG